MEINEKLATGAVPPSGIEFNHSQYEHKLSRDTIDQVRYAIEQGKIGQISTTREYEWLQNQYLNYQKSLEKEKPIPDQVQENPEKNKFLKHFI